MKVGQGRDTTCVSAKATTSRCQAQVVAALLALFGACQLCLLHSMPGSRYDDVPVIL
jgi:hypothetical protein